MSPVGVNNARRAPVRPSRAWALCLLALAGAPGCPPAGPRVLSAWIVGADEDVEPSAAPQRENAIYSAKSGVTRLVAASNETLALQLVLRSPRPPDGPFELRISDLAGPGGVIQSAQSVRLFRAQFQTVEQFASWYPEHTGRPATPRVVADALVPWEAPRGGGPLKLDDDQAQIVWIDLHVPAGLGPGEYTGKLELLAPREPAPRFRSDLRLNVLPVEIPGERGLRFVCRVEPRDLLSRQLGWPRVPAEETRVLPSEPDHEAAQRLLDQTMRLLHTHRVSPVLWAAFPKYRVLGDEQVELDWAPYDALVERWLDGQAFDDRQGLAAWIAPLSEDYPDADLNGGFASARYARLLAAYLAECQRHFESRGWFERAVLRPLPPQPLASAAIERFRRLAAIVGQQASDWPLVAHLPRRSLRALSWQNAPTDDPPEAGIWAPPAAWLEPAVMREAQSLGSDVWFIPAEPPYSGSLALAAPRVDPRVLAWQAARYGYGGVWIEHAVDVDAREENPPAPLALPGADYGLEAPIPTVRLKQIRRGLLDAELLKLLAERGKPLLAQRVAERIVRWSFTDACLDNLLSCRPAGWPRDAQTFELARRLVLHELAAEAGAGFDAPSFAEWARIMATIRPSWAEIRGARVAMDGERLEAQVFAVVDNRGDTALDGRWSFPTLPAGWSAPGETALSVPAGARQEAVLRMGLEAIGYDRDGVVRFAALFDTRAAGALRAEGRLAVTRCPLVERAPRIDGDVSDWNTALANVAADFRLCRGAREPGAAPGAPTLPTQAYFCRDRSHFYVGVYCATPPGERTTWSADNRTALDGPTPWGQDLVEVLLTPSGQIAGSGRDLYTLQVKPSGLLTARQGALTDPPMNPSEPWQPDARAAVREQRGAWTVELAIPLAAFGADAAAETIWGCNVTRVDARRGEYSSWSGATGFCYAPQLLGNLIMAP